MPNLLVRCSPMNLDAELALSEVNRGAEGTMRARAKPPDAQPEPPEAPAGAGGGGGNRWADIGTVSGGEG